MVTYGCMGGECRQLAVGEARPGNSTSEILLLLVPRMKFGGLRVPGVGFPGWAHKIHSGTGSLFVAAGFGFGLIYLPSVIVVSYYFQRRRALATGIAVCGAGVGCFIFAPAGWLLQFIY